MTAYLYQAYTANGSHVSGTVDAAGEADALMVIRRLGYSPYRLETNERSSSPKRVRPKELTERHRSSIARRLTGLLEANVPVADALSLLVGQRGEKKPQVFLHAVLDSMTAGQKASIAFRADGAGFTEDECMLLSAAEEAGDLRYAFREIASSLEDRIALRAKLTSTLIYPAILLIVALAAIAVIAGVLVPSLAPLFETAKVEPPFLVAFVLWLGQLPAVSVPVALLGASVFALTASRLLKINGVKQLLEKVTRRLPVFRQLTLLSERTRLCRTLGALMTSGVRLDSAISAAGAVSRRAATRGQMQEARNAVMGGKRLSEALSAVDAMDPSTLGLIQIAEKANSLPAMLQDVAKSSGAQLTQTAERLVTLLTPILTILIGGLVGSLIISVMQALLSVNELAI